MRVKFGGCYEPCGVCDVDGGVGVDVRCVVGVGGRYCVRGVGHIGRRYVGVGDWQQLVFGKCSVRYCHEVLTYIDLWCIIGT